MLSSSTMSPAFATKSNNHKFHTPKEIAALKVGSEPVELDVNEKTNTVYVANINNSTVSVIDGKTNKVIGLPIIVHDGPDGVAVNEKTNTVYVANYNDGTVSVIDGKTTRFSAAFQ